MPAGMFSIDSILSAWPSCKEPLPLHRSGPVVLPASLTDSLYADNSGLYSSTCGPCAAGVQPLGGTAIEYNGYYYGQLHVQQAGGGPLCCGSAAVVLTFRVLCTVFFPLHTLNQLHCRWKRRHWTIFTDEQLEALEGLFQEIKYPDVGMREQLARKVHLREEKVEIDPGFHINLKKTDPVPASTHMVNPKLPVVRLHGQVLENVTQFQYLGSCVLSNTDISDEMEHRLNPPLFNLFGAEPTLNAQITSFHTDSSVSGAELLPRAPEQTLASTSPMP
ncbi:homeobox protein goosecoid-like [Thalassophryne amazonica]|uniref:homeobox protein goosecoid-like n=1 Tax=Thalassophryne amazonica TaxID=390379 RepID=UPI0014726069|nr:homeobox protein goosecoid-like [Thalassophryne amazonica]